MSQVSETSPFYRAQLSKKLSYSNRVDGSRSNLRNVMIEKTRYVLYYKVMSNEWKIKE
jgi:hypothetical protein